MMRALGTLSTGNPGLNAGRNVEVCECGKSFSTVEALEAHRASQGYACAAILEEKMLALQENGERHLKCHFCPKLFKTYEARTAHEVKKHPIDPELGRPIGRSY